MAKKRWFPRIKLYCFTTHKVTICVCIIAKISNFAFVTSVKRLPYTLIKSTAVSTYRTVRDLTQVHQV
jgi:hypothetical protein